MSRSFEAVVVVVVVEWEKSRKLVKKKMTFQRGCTKKKERGRDWSAHKEQCAFSSFSQSRRGLAVPPSRVAVNGHRFSTLWPALRKDQGC